MGLENRDYARANSDRGGWSTGNGHSGSFQDWEFWKKIIAANVIVFLLQIFVTRPATVQDWMPADRIQEFEEQPFIEDGSSDQISDIEQLRVLNAIPNQKISIFQDWFELDSSKVIQGQIWRLVTCGFCHDRTAIWHLLFNMLFLYWFGSRLEFRFGSSEFAAFYFASLLASSMAYIALDLYTGTLIPAIGASGAVWGVVALYALLYPYEQVRVYLLFPVQIRFLAIIYFLYDLHPVLLALSGDTVFTGVAHAAHIGGAIFGFCYYKLDWRLMPWLRQLSRTNKKQWANSKTSRTEREEQSILSMPEQFRRMDSEEEMHLDAILEKISSEGQDSLTEDEQEFLANASRKLKGL